MRNFWKDEAGNTAMMFSVSLIGILAAAGMAMDYGRVRSEQSTLQAQVDAAVLALSKSDAKTDDERQGVLMGSLLENGYVVGNYVPRFRFVSDGTVRVTASSDYTPIVMGIFGKSKVKIEAIAESRTAKEGNVELVMVLDTTDSMQGAKLTALKDAATGLVNSFANVKDANVKIGLVPFSNYVNVGTHPSVRNASWLSVPQDTIDLQPQTRQPTRVVTPRSCTGSETFTAYQDGAPVTRTRQTGCTPAVTAPNGQPVTTMVDVGDKWHGCVGSRPDLLHKRDSDYATRVPGLMNVECANELVPLTLNYGDMRNKISALSVSKNTYMPAGIMWGQRVLSPNIPYDQGALSTDEDQKIMIIMTDGDNSMYLQGAEHLKSSPKNNQHATRMDVTNRDTEDACTLAKSAGTEVFTIAFEVSDTSTKSMLERCATDSSHYFDARNSQQLVSVFDNIASQIFQVRLTK